MDQEFIDKIIDYAKSIYSEVDLAHRWDHIQRVCDLAVLLAEKEGADIEVVRIAAYLHDVGYKGMTTEEMVEKCHAELSATMTKELLQSLSLDEVFIEKVCETIITHRTSRITEDTDIEGLCLHDADKLDSSGVRGFMRLYAWNLLVEPRGLELNELIKFVRDSTLKRKKRLKTDTAREIIDKLDENVNNLVELYEEEMEIKCLFKFQGQLFKQ